VETSYDVEVVYILKISNQYEPIVQDSGVLQLGGVTLRVFQFGSQLIISFRRMVEVVAVVLRDCGALC